MGTGGIMAPDSGVDGSSTPIRRVTKLLKFACRTATNVVMVKMGNSDDKAALLRSLAIDRSMARTAPRRWLVPTAVGGGSAAVIVIAAFLLMQVWADRFTDRAATSQPPDSASLQASAPAADPRRTGGLP